MVLRRPRPAGPVDRIGTPVEEWPFLDQEVLVPARSRKVCMTCHWFEHHSGVNCIPLLTCQLHQGPDRPRRAPHQPLPGLDRRYGPSRGQRSLIGHGR
jgi:hypothetical protein